MRTITSPLRYASLPVVATLLALPAFAVELETDRYVNTALGVRFTVPASWTISRHTGYAPLLAILTHGELPSAQITISYEEPKAGARTEALVRENNQAMRKIGFQIIASGAVQRLGRTVWRSRARFTRGGRSVAVRQLYLRETSGRMFVVTVSARDIESVLADFDMLLDSLEITQRKN